MKKKFILLSIIASSICACGGKTISTSDSISESISFDESSSSINEESSQSSLSSERNTENMSECEIEFFNYIDNKVDFPTTFIYDGTFYKGFKDFKLIDKIETLNNKNHSVDVALKYLHKDQKLCVEIKAAFYKDYDAYEWIVYFKNTSINQNTAMLSDVNAADMYFKGNNPKFKGNKGDYGGYYEPIITDLTKQNVELKAITGRDCEEYMPYFNVETDDGGAMMAVGWPGTWRANFENTKDGVHYQGTGTVGLNLYLKPGEQIRTPLMAFVRYYDRNNDDAVNKWRRWFLDCNIPYEDANETHRINEGQTCVFFACDTGKGWYTGGSEFEDSTTWDKSIQECVKHKMRFDYHHFDAGWYYDVGGYSIGDSWYSVGSWSLNRNKWPEDSFKRYTDTCKQKLGVKGSLMWFEVERVNGVVDQWCNYTGGNPDWLIPNDGSNFLYNLGNPDAVDFIFNKITNVMSECGIDVYREDHNFSPNSAFKQGDALQGRSGITENLHFQGKFDLWDRILSWQKENNKAGFIEMQSSGGNRQDLELLRRSVSFYRSDSDITLNPCFTISKITNLNKWIPFGGTLFSRLSNTNSPNPRNTFQWRSTYSSLVCVAMPFQSLNDNTWSVIENGMEEYQTYRKYVLKDMYELTPTKPNMSESQWVSREYFDPKVNEGVIETFRFNECLNGSLLVKLKGLDKNAYYTLTDPDQINGINKIKGDVLMEEGIEIYLPLNSSSILWIKQIDK